MALGNAAKTNKQTNKQKTDKSFLASYPKQKLAKFSHLNLTYSIITKEILNKLHRKKVASTWSVDGAGHNFREHIGCHILVSLATKMSIKQTPLESWQEMSGIATK